MTLCNNYVVFISYLSRIQNVTCIHIVKEYSSVIERYFKGVTLRKENVNIKLY